MATRHGAYTVMLCLVPDGLRGEGRHVGTWGCATGVQYACVGFFWTINLCSQDNRLRADSTASVSVSLSPDAVWWRWGSLVQGAAASLRIHTHAHRHTCFTYTLMPSPACKPAEPSAAPCSGSPGAQLPGLQQQGCLVEVTPAPVWLAWGLLSLLGLAVPQIP